jgi:hypothetical protein
MSCLPARRIRSGTNQEAVGWVAYQAIPEPNGSVINMKTFATHKSVSKIARVVLCCLVFPGICSPQSFLFVSPNTRDQMSDEMAWNSLLSFEQQNFVAVAHYLGTKICSRPKVESTEGMDGTTTENSSLITGCTGNRARYLGELLGRYAHQKWIFIFDPASNEKERLLILSFSAEKPQDIPQQLRQYGFTAATILAQDKSVRVFLWVKDNAQDAAINSLVQAVHAGVQQLNGKATFIGNDSRSLAKGIFDHSIQKYERMHQQFLSKLLGSAKLHDLGLSGVP